MVIDLNTFLLFAVIAILILLILKMSNNAVGRSVEFNESSPVPTNQAAITVHNPVCQPGIVRDTEPNPEAENSISLHELFELEEIPATELNVYERPQEVSPSSSYLQVLGEFVKATGNYKQVGQTFKICFKPEIEEGLRNGTFELMNWAGGKQLTAVHSAQRKVIAGNGWVESARADKLIALTSLAWQGMAIITAQKFLADINKSLEEIKSSIDGLKEIHDAEIEGKIIGWQSYIKQAAERLAGNINITEKSTIAAQLETVHRLSLEEYFATEHRLKFHLKALGDLLNNKKANDKTAQEVKDKCAAIEKEANRLLGFARINVANMMALTMRLDFGAEIVLRDNALLLEESLGRVISELNKSIKKAKSLPAGLLRDTIVPIIATGAGGIFLGWAVDMISKDWAEGSRKMMGNDTHSLQAKLRKQQAAQLKFISSAQERLRKPPSLYLRVGANSQIEQVEPIRCPE